MNEFKTWLQAKIQFIETHPDPTIKDDTGEHDCAPEPEDQEDFAHIVREAYNRAAGFEYANEPPKSMLSKSDALYYLKSVSAFVDGQHIQETDFVTPEEAAERLQVSKDSIYDLIKQGRLDHTKVGRLIRIKRSALEHIQQNDGW